MDKFLLNLEGKLHICSTCGFRAPKHVITNQTYVQREVLYFETHALNWNLITVSESVI